MRNALILAAVLLAGFAKAGETAAEILNRPTDVEAGRLREQAYVYQSLAYVEAAASMCHRIVNLYPNSREAGEAKARLIELSALRRQLTAQAGGPAREAPPAAPEYPPADEMLTHALEYEELKSEAGLLAAEILFQDIIRRYPGTPEAMRAAERLLGFAARRSPPRAAGGKGDAAGPGEAKTADGKPPFSFDDNDETEWSLPRPEDLYGLETR